MEFLQQTKITPEDVITLDDSAKEYYQHAIDSGSTRYHVSLQM